MGRNQIINSVCRIISEHFKVSIQDLTLNTNLIRDLGADSVDALALMLTFEESFGIPFILFKKQVSISDIVDTIYTYTTDAK